MVARVTSRFLMSRGVALALGIALVSSCDKGSNKGTNEPDDGTNLLGVKPASSPSDSKGDDLDEEADADDPFTESALSAEDLAVTPRPELPPRAKEVTKCATVREGGKKKKECKPVDPKPEISAEHGVYTLMGDFRWGMSPAKVFKLLSRDIEAEAAKRQETATGPIEQDAARQWRHEQLQLLRGNYTKFTTASGHRWGVSLIQFEYEDNANEEMLWIRTANGLRKFYFFKDGSLWKVFYAYGTDVWPGKSYADILQEKFYRWFGPSPEQKTKIDPKTSLPMLRYTEWKAQDGEKVRSFDMTELHGVVGLTVVDGPTEQRIGERLPNMPQESQYEGVVEGVFGGSDVCYNPDGNIVECSESEAMGFDK